MSTDNIVRIELKGELERYGDWRDDVLAMGISLGMPRTMSARPICPQHGPWFVCKRGVSRWKCTYVDERARAEIRERWHQEHPGHNETTEGAAGLVWGDSDFSIDYQRAMRYAGECGFEVKVDAKCYREWHERMKALALEQYHRDWPSKKAKESRRQ
jgi:hypothetical protein